MIIPGKPEYSDVEVSFSYLDFWPMYFDLNCKGEVCEPESISSNLLSFMGIQRYNFAYDASFPVLVEVYDPDAFKGRGFKFNFFLEANVRNNKELESNFMPLQYATVPEFSGLCDLTNRNSGNISVQVRDSISNSPLDEVSVTVSVAGENCFVGSTNESGVLVTQFPTGTAGAVIGFIKESYITKSALFDAPLNKPGNVDAKISPIKAKKVVLKKKLVEKQGSEWVFTNRETNLEANEEAIITLTRISPLTEDDFNSIANIKGPSNEQLQIAPGDYELAINMFLRDTVRIPKKTITKNTGLFTTETFEMPGFEFNEQNPMPSGGVRLNVTITEADLKKDTIVLYAVSPALQFVPELERSLEDLEQTARIDTYSKIFAPLLVPQFK